MPLSTFNLNNFNNNYGFTVTTQNGYSSFSSAGDFDCDGYMDYIIGIKTLNVNGKNGAGAAYLCYGSALNQNIVNLDTAKIPLSVCFNITGSNINENLGAAVAGIGDIDNNGCDDVAIGAPLADVAGRTDAGIVTILLGRAGLHSSVVSSQLSPSDGFKIIGPEANSYLGNVISTAGKANGDNYDDFILGLPSASSNGRSQSGISYLLYGKASGFTDIDLAQINSTIGISIAGPTSGAGLGIGAANIGDFNKDGKSDNIVASMCSNPYDAGVGYAIMGSSSLSNIDLLTAQNYGFNVTGIGGNKYYKVAKLGDFNNNGYDDVLICGQGVSYSGRSLAGACAVIYGQASGSGNIDLSSSSGTWGFKVYGPIASSGIGRSVAGIGDITKNGCKSFIIGSSTGINTQNSGVWVVYGNPNQVSDIDLATANAADATVITRGTLTTYDVAGLGDVIGKDGYDDFAVGNGLTIWMFSGQEFARNYYPGFQISSTGGQASSTGNGQYVSSSSSSVGNQWSTSSASQGLSSSSSSSGNSQGFTSSSSSGSNGQGVVSSSTGLMTSAASKSASLGIYGEIFMVGMTAMSVVSEIASTDFRDVFDFENILHIGCCNIANLDC